MNDDIYSELKTENNYLRSQLLKTIERQVNPPVMILDKDNERALIEKLAVEKYKQRCGWFKRFLPK